MRSIRRKKQLAAKKKLRKKLKKTESTLGSAPNECCACGLKFSPQQSPQQLDEWIVRVLKDSVTFTCPECEDAK